MLVPDQLVDPIMLSVMNSYRCFTCSTSARSDPVANVNFSVKSSKQKTNNRRAKLQACLKKLSKLQLGEKDREEIGKYEKEKGKNMWMGITARSFYGPA